MPETQKAPTVPINNPKIYYAKGITYLKLHDRGESY
jgi:hypothetical protein